MTASDISQIIIAITGLVTSAGVIVVAFIQRGQAKTLMQVEKQGNSRDLEMKRLIMVYSRRTHVATGEAADRAIADDAQKVYEEAKAAAERDGVLK